LKVENQAPLVGDNVCALDRLLSVAARNDERPSAQTEALDALLDSREDASTSVLAWTRQPPGVPGHKALKRIVEQIAHLRTIGLDPAIAEGVHPERLRKLAREGGRFAHQTKAV
jgi:hypothetical protein